MDLIIGLSK